MKKLLLPALLCGVVALSACSDPKATQLPASISGWGDNAEFKKQAAKLSDEDKALLARYAIRAGLAEAMGAKPSDASVMPKTIGEAIEAEKKVEAAEKAEGEKQEALKKEQAAKDKAFADTVASTLTVAITEYAVLPKDAMKGRYNDVAAASIAYKNTSQKDIKGVSGSIEIVDMFGKVLKDVKVDYTDGIKAGDTAVYKGEMQLNEFMEADKALYSLTIDKFTTKFKPSAIVFADGTTLKP